MAVWLQGLFEGLLLLDSCSARGNAFIFEFLEYGEAKINAGRFFSLAYIGVWMYWERMRNWMDNPGRMEIFKKISNAMGIRPICNDLKMLFSKFKGNPVSCYKITDKICPALNRFLCLE